MLLYSLVWNFGLYSVSIFFPVASLEFQLLESLYSLPIVIIGARITRSRLILYGHIT